MSQIMPWTATALLALMPSVAHVATSLAPMFSDSMVLQHGMPITIHGKGEPGTQLTVSFLSQERTTIVGDDGSWAAELKELAPSTSPAKLSVASGEDVLVLRDILVGDVW